MNISTGAQWLQEENRNKKRWFSNFLAFEQQNNRHGNLQPQLYFSHGKQSVQLGRINKGYNDKNKNYAIFIE